MNLKIVGSTQIKNTLAIAAGKGGVGKSTLTVLLASALVRLNQRVGIVDADIYGPSMRQMLGEEKPPNKEGGKLIPAESKGIQFLSLALFQQLAIVRAPIANQLIGHLLQNSQWGELDWMLIDFPPGTGDVPLTCAEQANLSGALLITTPQEVALLDVTKAALLFRKVGVPILGIVENMSYFGDTDCRPFGKGGGWRLARELDIPFLGELPLDPAFSKGGDEGRLAELSVKVIDGIAERLKENLVTC